MTIPVEDNRMQFILAFLLHRLIQNFMDSTFTKNLKLENSIRSEQIRRNILFYHLSHTNVPLYLVKHFRKQKWHFGALSYNVYLTRSFYEENVHENWDYVQLSSATWLTWDHVREKIEKPWQWKILTQHPNISANTIIDNLTYPGAKWDMHTAFLLRTDTSLNVYFKLYKEKVIQLPNGLLNWEAIMHRPDFAHFLRHEYGHLRNLNDMPQLRENLNWSHVTTRVSISFIIEHLEWPWAWHLLDHHPMINMQTFRAMMKRIPKKEVTSKILEGFESVILRLILKQDSDSIMHQPYDFCVPLAPVTLPDGTPSPVRVDTEDKNVNHHNWPLFYAYPSTVKNISKHVFNTQWNINTLDENFEPFLRGYPDFTLSKFVYRFGILFQEDMGQTNNDLLISIILARCHLYDEQVIHAEKYITQYKDYFMQKSKELSIKMDNKMDNAEPTDVTIKPDPEKIAKRKQDDSTASQENKRTKFSL